MRRDLVAIQRQILDAKEAVELERARSVSSARADVRLLLGQHGLFTASFAMRTNAAGSFLEYARVSSTIREGGYHRVRLKGSKTING